MATTERVFQLSGSCNNYDWGRKGTDSLAARLCEKTPGTGFKIDNDTFYSEMWFGDYPDFPGRVLATGETLGDHLQKHKETLLGAKVIKRLDGQLPYLPKILSIGKALPLQVHPNKELAAQLHAEKPDQFTDPNHKPEIAVALSRFEVFAGWKRLDAISPLFNIPALRRFLPDDASDADETGPAVWTDETLRAVTRAILSADDAAIQDAQAALANAAPLPGGDGDAADNGYILDLLPRLQAQYGGRDPGVLVALLCMNFLTLEAGDALYVPADGIHAYLSGDIVECMARSNNVLNTGFCPRASRDSVDLFCRTLTFKGARDVRKELALPRRPSDRGRHGKTGVYAPPLSEFNMLCSELGGIAGEEEVIEAGDGPSVAIVTEGEGKLTADGKTFEAKAGFIFFVAPGVEATWRNGSDGAFKVFTTVV